VSLTKIDPQQLVCGLLGQATNGLGGLLGSLGGALGKNLGTLCHVSPTTGKAGSSTTLPALPAATGGGGK